MLIKNKNQSQNINSKQKKPWLLLLLLLPLALYFYFGWQHLGKFETADEHYWIYSNTDNNNYWNHNNGRIEQYWQAIFSKNWAKTRINDKPGITLAYVSGIGPSLLKNLNKQIASGAISFAKSTKAQIVNVYFRLPILIFNGLFIFALFYLIRKLIGNKWIALLSVTFILLSPIIVGVSQIVNPDSLLWEFGFAAILSFLIFLKDKAKKYAFWTSLFLGLSLLTKYTSVILLPFFLAVMLAYIIENSKNWKPDEISQNARRYSLAYLLIVAGALAIYAVLMPDNLVNFDHFLKGTIGFKGMASLFAGLFILDLAILADALFLNSRALHWTARKTFLLEKYFKLVLFLLLPLLFLGIIFNTISGKDLLRLFTIPFDASPNRVFGHISNLKIFAMQFLPLIFSLSPLVILSLFYFSWKNRQESEFQWLGFVFYFFILIFVIASMQQEVLLTVRYSIMLYPLIFTLSAIGIYQFFKLDAKKLSFRLIVFFAIIIFSLFSLWSSQPFYFNYANLLLSKNYLISDGWGYGGYEAAQYLNALPGAGQMRVWSDYNGFCLFFDGQCEANKVTMKDIQKKSATPPAFDYFISTRRGRILSGTFWDGLKNTYDSRAIWKFIINGRPGNFIAIYKNKNDAHQTQ